MPSYILLIRAEEQALETQKQLAALGYQTHLNPLFTIKYKRDKAFSLYQGAIVLFSSVHGILGYMMQKQAVPLPFIAIGENTKTYAEALGFTTCLGCFQDRDDFLKHKAALRQPIIYPTTKDSPTSFIKALPQCYAYYVYEAQAKCQFHKHTKQLFMQKQISHVLLYSPRSAEIFMQTVEKYNYQNQLSTAKALCISPNTAKILPQNMWQEIKIAELPQQASLFALLS